MPAGLLADGMNRSHPPDVAGLEVLVELRRAIDNKGNLDSVFPHVGFEGDELDRHPRREIGTGLGCNTGARHQCDRPDNREKDVSHSIETDRKRRYSTQNKSVENKNRTFRNRTNRLRNADCNETHALTRQAALPGQRRLQELRAAWDPCHRVAACARDDEP